jgi:hypothetical protein
MRARKDENKVGILEGLCKSVEEVIVVKDGREKWREERKNEDILRANRG